MLTSQFSRQLRWLRKPPLSLSALPACRPTLAVASLTTESTEPTELPPHTSVKIPDFGSKGTVLKWLKSVGEAVDEGSLLVDVSFDDFDVEIVSEHKGFVAQIKAAPSDGPLPAGSDLCVIVPDGDFVAFFSHDFLSQGPGSSARAAPQGIAAEPAPAQKAAQEAAQEAAQDLKAAPSKGEGDAGTVSGLQILTAIKKVAAARQGSGDPIGNDQLFVLKELAVRESPSLQAAFFAASFASGPDATDNFDYEEFLALALPEVEKQLAIRAAEAKSEADIEAGQDGGLKK